MRMVPDSTGRLRRRPHYDPGELDLECEDIVRGFLRQQHGTVSYPITTDDLWVLIGRETSSLDAYADLKEDGASVDGVTDFLRNSKPRVRISAELSNDSRRENRLRTTITHEYGHVKFHAPLWMVDNETLPLFGESRISTATPNDATARCKRETIVDGSTKDWMEWQAGYICGAILMPAHPTRELVRAVVGPSPSTVIRPRDQLAVRLIEAVQERFMVSGDAARVRLLKLGVLTTDDGTLVLSL